MLDEKKYDDISLKAVTYPLIIALHDLLEDLLSFESSQPDKGALSLLEWSDRLSNYALQADEAAKTYAENLGYSTGYYDEHTIPMLSQQEQDEMNLSQ